MEEELEYRFIQDFLEDPSSRTGYSITTLIRGKLEKKEVAKSVYDLQFDPQYVFPMITETPRVPTYDERGIIVELTKAAVGDAIWAGYGFGVPKTIGHVMRVEGRELVFKAKEFNEEMSGGFAVYYENYCKGKAIPVGREDLVLRLSDDALVQCIDWTKGETKHSVKSLEFLADVINNKRNCYWISIYDLYGRDLVYDCVCLFLHHAKDPFTPGGDLNKDSRSREERKRAL